MHTTYLPGSVIGPSSDLRRSSEALVPGARGAAPRLIAAVVLCTLTGCGTIPFHSETRDKQGQAARSAWSEVNVRNQLQVARDNLVTLSQRELEVVDKLASARRDVLARGMAVGGSVEEMLVNPTNAALTRLAGSAELAQSWTAASVTERLARQKVRDVAQEFADVGLEMPLCSDIVVGDRTALDPLSKAIDNGGPRGDVVRQGLDVARRVCASADLSATSSVKVSGEIAATVQELRLSTSALESARTKTLNLRNAYKVALDAHQKAAEELSKSGKPEARQKLLEAAADAQKAVDALDKAGDAFSQRFLSEQRQDSINRFLSALAESEPGQPTPEGASRSAVALILLADVADSTKKALADAKAPTLTALVLRKDLEKIKFDAATREIAALEAKAQNRQEKIALQTKQAGQFLNAMRGFQTGEKRFYPLTLDVALGEVQEPKLGSPATAEEIASQGRWRALRDSQNTLIRAAASYLDAESRLHGEIRKTNARVRAMEHEQALAAAESNVAQWQALISSGVDQLAAFGSSGIRPERITALINSLTLLWIGVGVN